MRTIYVDYENVQSAGLDGVELLYDTDKIVLFYSAHAETMKIDIVRQLLNSTAEIEFVEAETGTMNALDFQLLAALFINASKEDEAFIISRDTGFDPAIHLGTSKGFLIKRIPTIQGIFREPENADNTEENQPLEYVDTAISDEIISFELSPITNAHRGFSLEKIELIVAEKCGKNFAEKYSELIVSGLKKSSNKNQFYQFFRTKLGDAEGGDLYRSIRNKFDEMKEIVL